MCIRDRLWAAASKRFKRVIDVFATLVLLFVVTVQTIMLADKVWITYSDHLVTFDLRIPTWPFALVAWLGDVSAVMLIMVRTYRLIFRPDTMYGGDGEGEGTPGETTAIARPVE